MWYKHGICGKGCLNEVGQWQRKCTAAPRDALCPCLKVLPDPGSTNIVWELEKKHRYSYPRPTQSKVVICALASPPRDLLQAEV